MDQKAGILDTAGCLNHTSMIWLQVQNVNGCEQEVGTDLCVVILDVANAFGSVPHSFIWASLDFFRFPDIIKKPNKIIFSRSAMPYLVRLYHLALIGDWHKGMMFHLHTNICESKEVIIRAYKCLLASHEGLHE